MERGIVGAIALGLLVVQAARAGETTDQRILTLEAQLAEAQRRIRRLERALEARGGPTTRAGNEAAALLLETLHKQGIVKDEDYAALRATMAKPHEPAGPAVATAEKPSETPKPEPAPPPAGIPLREQEPGDDVQVAATPSVRLSTNYKIGKGIVIRSNDGRFDAVVSNRIQTRYTYTDEQDDPARQDSSSFRIRRATTLIYGHVLDPSLAYRLQVSWAPSVRLDDAYLQWQPRPWAGIKGGQFRVPFARQNLSSAATLQFVDRSITDDFFSFGRDRGVTVIGNELGEKHDELQWELGIFNGNGVGPSNNENSDHLAAARVLWMPLGAFDYYVESDVRGTPDLRVGVAGGGAYNSQAQSTGRPGQRPPILEDDRFLRWFGAGVQDRFDIAQATADVQLKYHGFSALGDFHWAEANPSTLPTKRARGLNVQMGYFLIPHHLEIAGRYASISRDLSTSRSGVREWGGAIGWFFLAHSLKLQLDVRDIVDEDPAMADHHFQEYRLQLQTVF